MKKFLLRMGTLGIVIFDLAVAFFFLVGTGVILHLAWYPIKLGWRILP